MLNEFINHDEKLICYNLIKEKIDPELIASAFNFSKEFVQANYIHPGTIRDDNNIFKRNIVDKKNPMEVVYRLHMRNLSHEEILDRCYSDIVKNMNSPLSLVAMTIDYYNFQRKAIEEGIGFLIENNISRDVLFKATGINHYELHLICLNYKRGRRMGFWERLNFVFKRKRLDIECKKIG